LIPGFEVTNSETVGDDELIGLRGEREDCQTQANGRKEEDSNFHKVPDR